MTCSRKTDKQYNVYDNDMLRQTDRQMVSMTVTCSRKTDKPKDSVYGNDLLRQTDRQTVCMTTTCSDKQTARQCV